MRAMLGSHVRRIAVAMSYGIWNSNGHAPRSLQHAQKLDAARSAVTRTSAICSARVLMGAATASVAASKSGRRRASASPYRSEGKVCRSTDSRSATISNASGRGSRTDARRRARAASSVSGSRFMTG